jgi:hypothetical protein
MTQHAIGGLLAGQEGEPQSVPEGRILFLDQAALGHRDCDRILADRTQLALPCCRDGTANPMVPSSPPPPVTLPRSRNRP